jgi:hypothetical protein
MSARAIPATSCDGADGVVLSTVQLLGTRAPGLPQHIRHSPQWEALREQIYARALHFGAQLTYDFRELLTDPPVPE